jgi:hypothetical protein
MGAEYILDPVADNARWLPADASHIDYRWPVYKPVPLTISELDVQARYQDPIDRVIVLPGVPYECMGCHVVIYSDDHARVLMLLRGAEMAILVLVWIFVMGALGAAKDAR